MCTAQTEEWTKGIRAYTNKTPGMRVQETRGGEWNSRLYKQNPQECGLKKGWLKLLYCLPSAEADIVCLGAVSTAVFAIAVFSFSSCSAA